MSRAHDSERISPTAYYTSETWIRNGLSAECLQTSQGRRLWMLLQPFMAISRGCGGPTFEDFLLARHVLLDFRLRQGIESGKVSHVIELASGLSARGIRFSQRYGGRLTYIETDLPAMTARKMKLLGARAKNHHLVSVDVLRREGETSLDSLVRSIDAASGVAVVSEGLLNYFSRSQVVEFWANVSSILKRFRSGLYLTDLHVKEASGGFGWHLYRYMLSVFVRGGVYLDFESVEDVVASMRHAGFDSVDGFAPAQFGDVLPSCRAKGARIVRVFEARLGLNGKRQFNTAF